MVFQLDKDLSARQGYFGDAEGYLISTRIFQLNKDNSDKKDNSDNTDSKDLSAQQG